ncbi:MAG: hypothetical protein O6952_06530 [Planctomycetota bacterium]|nr:hypothetical protein [Planctomycetota bacterium]
MERIFIGLALWNALILGFAGTTGLGWGPAAGHHLIVGLFAAIFSCLVHSIVMGHLIGAGRAIKEAAVFLDDPDRFLIPNRRLKGRVFPLATFAPLATVVAAILGGGVGVGSLPRWAHLGTVILAVVLNFAAYPREIQGIRRTSELIRQINLLLQEEEEMKSMIDPAESSGDVR